MTRPSLPPYLEDSLPGRRGWPLAFAHRGADTARENTLAAFRTAVERGYGYLELDVRTSRDGVLMVFHDEYLDRVTTGSGRLSDHTWEELTRLRVIDPARDRRAGIGTGVPTASGWSIAARTRARGGAGVPGTAARGPAAPAGAAVGTPAGEHLLRFEDLLTEWEDVRLNVDLKDDAAAEAMARIVARHGAWDRVLVASFRDTRRRRFGRVAGRRVAMSGGALAIAALVLAAPLGLVRVVAGRLAHVDCVQVPVRQGPVRVVTRAFVARCQAAGLQVHVWVVDDPAEMERLLALGVDGIMTDDAEALAAVLQARGQWPQR
ncbi:glycerophosphodiester phosphodiesterase [Citricoccus sp. SGAir0253]|uniref:glycerophosphodiester phosphodiesterase family protein n=1 Tax=Citricoccus sp. SGAir0253 TaxID=2567881 RepID=UPI0010CCFB6A|nr:glycerophosphodiester phosphodiesterase family protein [Citricoccus sp. SGAir0253]QCU76825.1 glycerophosphodiester phosphodiesterase [Citricoccus sp. SGAir0253]